MKTDPRAAIAAHLIPVAAFPAVARNARIRLTDRTLVATGRLIRVTIGHRDYYSLPEVLQAAPGTCYPVITGERPALAALDHTITVERVDPATARAWIPVHRPDDLIGGLAVVERHNGRLAKVCALEPDMLTGPEATARSYASGYGARYVPAGGA